MSEQALSPAIQFLMICTVLLIAPKYANLGFTEHELKAIGVWGYIADVCMGFRCVK